MEEEEKEEEEEEEAVVVSTAGKGKGREQAKTKKRPEKSSIPAEPREDTSYRSKAEGASGGKPGQVRKSVSVVLSDTDDNKVADVEELNDPPCKRCAKSNTPCVVQPEPKKSDAKDRRSRHRLVCLPCRDSKNKCELASKKARSPSPGAASAPARPDTDVKDNVVPAPTKPKRAPRKKLQVVPPGAPGEYTS